MTFSMRNALSAGGWLVASAALVGGSIFGDVAEPLDRTTDLIAGSPAAESPCPDGWADTSTRDEHAIVLSCQLDGWTVWLTPEGQFNYAWDGKSKDFQYDAGKVPAWPASD